MLWSGSSYNHRKRKKGAYPFLLYDDEEIGSSLLFVTYYNIYDGLCGLLFNYCRYCFKICPM